ncbi:MAG: hypothetical protein JXR19_08565 [Bacteroidia bacterium]
MKSKFWKAFILILFLFLFISAAWWMFNKYTLQSPYYNPIEEVDSTDRK